MLNTGIFKYIENLEHCYASNCQKSGSGEHVLVYILTLIKLSIIQISPFYFDYYTGIYFLFCFRLHSTNFKQSNIKPISTSR